MDKNNQYIKQHNFDFALLKKYESIMALGNGYLGTRAAFEESYSGSCRNTFVALEGERRLLDGKLMHLTQTTSDSAIEVKITTLCNLDSVKDFDKPEFKSIRRSILGSYEFTAEKDRGAVFEKIAVIRTSLDFDKDIDIRCLERGYDALFGESADAWAQYWKACEITLSGQNPMDLTALRFAQYHLRIMAPFHTNRLSIAAKGLTGEGYKGHVFWDCEVFQLPYFRDLFPEVARSLLEYRHHGLRGARKKAGDRGFLGAMYPWEAAASGLEETPYYGLLDIVSGVPNRVWAGEKELHITADIAYACMKYFGYTGDEDFMERYGYEIILDCAIFWASRAEYIPDKDHYENFGFNARCQPKNVFSAFKRRCNCPGRQLFPKKAAGN